MLLPHLVLSLYGGGGCPKGRRRGFLWVRANETEGIPFLIPLRSPSQYGTMDGIITQRIIDTPLCGKFHGLSPLFHRANLVNAGVLAVVCGKPRGKCVSFLPP